MLFGEFLFAKEEEVSGGSFIKGERLQESTV